MTGMTLQRCKSIPDPLMLSINSGGLKDLLIHLSSKLVGYRNHFELNLTETTLNLTVLNTKNKNHIPLNKLLINLKLRINHNAFLLTTI